MRKTKQIFKYFEKDEKNEGKSRSDSITMIVLAEVHDHFVCIIEVQISSTICLRVT